MSQREKTYGEWSRVVTTTVRGEGGQAMTMQHTEIMDRDAANERLMEAMLERGDASTTVWVDAVLNDWPGERWLPIETSFSTSATSTTRRSWTSIPAG